MANPTDGEGTGGGGVCWLLRLEAACGFVAALAAYHAIGGGWMLCAALFLVPDLAILGYLAGPRHGAAIYNAFHSYIAPAALAAVSLAAGSPHGMRLALIWAAHIAFDRAAGFGLKYPRGFGATHLGPLAPLRKGQG